MRIWLIGAGRNGVAALNQLRKNPDIEVVVSDVSSNPLAVRQGIIEAVDYVTNVTSVNVNDLARRIRPDLILFSAAGGDTSFGRMEGGQALTEALNYEIAAGSDYPCLFLSRSNLT
jgi:hypothetical protein